MDEFIKTNIESLKTGDSYNDYCINSALMHMEKVKEALHARENNPKQYYKDAIDHAKWTMKVTPILHLITEHLEK